VESSTVRVTASDKEALKRLSAETGEKMQDLVGEALELYRRTLFLKKANQAYAALRSDQEAWRQEKEERAAWENTLLDDVGDRDA